MVSVIVITIFLVCLFGYLFEKSIKNSFVNRLNQRAIRLLIQIKLRVRVFLLQFLIYLECLLNLNQRFVGVYVLVSAFS